MNFSGVHIDIPETEAFKLFTKVNNWKHRNHQDFKKRTVKVLDCCRKSLYLRSNQYYFEGDSHHHREKFNSRKSPEYICDKVYMKRGAWVLMQNTIY